MKDKKQNLKGMLEYLDKEIKGMRESGDPIDENQFFTTTTLYNIAFALDNLQTDISKQNKDIDDRLKKLEAVMRPDLQS